MIDIILGAVLTALLSFFVGKERLKKDWGWLVVSVLALVVTAGLTSTVEDVFYSPVTQKHMVKQVSVQEIVPLKEFSWTDSRYFLRLDTSEENARYVYAIETDKGYTRRTLVADKEYCPVYIKTIADNEQPRIEQYSGINQTVLQRKPTLWGSLFSYFSYQRYHVGDVIRETTPSPTASTQDDFRTVIYIPANTILN